MSAPEKLCIFCEHLEYNRAGNGEYAEPADLQCKRRHSLSDGRNYQAVYDFEDFRRMILTAEKCPDYSQVKS